MQPSSSILSAAVEEGVLSNPLTVYFLEKLISVAVPSVFGLLFLLVAKSIFQSNRKDEKKRSGGLMSKFFDDDNTESANSPVAWLYNDLYGDQDQRPSSSSRKPNLLKLFGGSAAPDRSLPQNIGVPAKQYIRITNLNDKLQSYRFSLTAATQSRAAAAREYRTTALRRAVATSLRGATEGASLTPQQLAQLAQAEQAFLAEGKELVGQLNQAQAELTEITLNQKMESMGIKSLYQLDALANNETLLELNKEDKTTKDRSAAWRKSLSKDLKSGWTTERLEELRETIPEIQQKLSDLELNFRQELIGIAGPTHAASLRAALVGSTSTSLLTALQDRPLSQVLAPHADDPDQASSQVRRPNLFVTTFPGDTTASQVRELREEVTAICQAAQPGDEALVILQTGGGTVTGYGLATAQLMRLKDKGLKLTIAVEQVAASGGYMMCCVADHIIASPFALLGSIGVISDIPNVYERLKAEGIEFQTVTAGKYKRTLTPTKKVTKEDLQKTTRDLEEVFILFRDFVAENRPQLDIENVATGETWFGTAALERKLCDEIKAVDDVILDYVQKGFEVLEVEYKPPAESVIEAFAPGRLEQERKSLIGRLVQYVVRSVASEIKAELGAGLDATKNVEKRYMAVDDTAERTRAEL